MYFITGLFLLLGAPLYAQPQIHFQARPQRVEIGASVELSWEVAEADAVYLTGYGLVASSGRLKAEPQKSHTTFALIAQSEQGLATEIVSIEVTGQRGDAFPAQDLFRQERLYEIAAPSLPLLLDGFHAVLQGQMKLVVDERYDRRTGQTVFATTAAQQPNLVQADENRIRARKLAYWVEVEPHKERAGRYICRIKAFIQYQRRKEQKWRPERQDALYHESAETLHQKVQAILADADKG